MLQSYEVKQSQVGPLQQHLRWSDLWLLNYKLRRNTMWTKPAATEMRFGFEVTMYVCNR